MVSRAGAVLLAGLALAPAACDQGKVTTPTVDSPPATVVQGAVEALLPGLQFGADAATDTYKEIRSVEVTGLHFVPAANRHFVHFCVEYTSPASDQVNRRCDLNVQIYQLDGGEWIGFATGSGTLYRWQAIGPPQGK